MRRVSDTVKPRMNRMIAAQASLALAFGLAALHAEPTLLDAGYLQMYNLQFDQAHRTFAEWRRLHPDDPMGPASDAAAYLFTEFDRLHIYCNPSSSSRRIISTPTTSSHPIRS